MTGQNGNAHIGGRILILEAGRQHCLGAGIVLPAENGGNRILLAAVGTAVQPERAVVFGGGHRAQGETVRFVAPVAGIVNGHAVLLAVVGKTGISRQFRPVHKLRRLQNQIDGAARPVGSQRAGLAAGYGTDGALDDFNILDQGRIHAVPHAARKRHVAYLYVTPRKTADGVLVRCSGHQHVPARIDGGIHAQGLHQGIGPLGLHQIPRNHVYRLRDLFRFHVRKRGRAHRLRPQGLGTDGHDPFRHFLNVLFRCRFVHGGIG